MVSESRDGFEESDILIEGPLQKRTFWFMWKERWCVLDRYELRLYRDETSYHQGPSSPLERYNVDTIRLDLDPHQPVITFSDVDTGESLMYLRAGSGDRWEEDATVMLWLAACCKARGETVCKLGLHARYH